MRADDAQSIVIAIEQLKGVLTVTPQVAELADVVATARVRQEMGRKLWDILYPPEQK